MAGSIIKLTALEILFPDYKPLTLSLVEKTVLTLLKEGYTQRYLSQLLQFNVNCVVKELIDKQLLYPDATFNHHPNNREAYKQGFIFRDEKKDMFFNRLIYAHEIECKEEVSLNCNLGDEYVSMEIPDTWFIINTFSIPYKPTEKTLRGVALCLI